MATLKVFETKEELILAYALYLHEIQLSCGGIYAENAGDLKEGQEVRNDERLNEYRISTIQTEIKIAARRIFFKVEAFKEDTGGAYGWVASGFGFCPTGDWQDKDTNLEPLFNKGIETVESNKKQTKKIVIKANGTTMSTKQIKTAVSALRPLTKEETRLATALNSSVNAIVTKMMDENGAVKLSPMMRNTAAASGAGAKGSTPAQVKEILMDLGYLIYKDPNHKGKGPAPEMISKTVN